MANLDVFGVQPQYDMDKAKEVLEAKLNQSWVKQRKQGSTTLSYIGGHTVIRLLNKAFGYQWSFEIVNEEIVASIPKWDKYKNTEVPQPPVAKVLGRLTVPGLGIKEQYGSKVLIGGATEQESAFKSASTDAMKKCASLFGIGLELYGDDEGFGDESQPSQVQPPQQQQYQKQYTQAPPQQQQYQQAPPQQQQQETPPPAQQQAAPQQQASAAPGGWVQGDIDRLKELKAILGITNNAQLDPYVREFFDNPNVTFANITPENIKAVNIFLAKKAESL